MSCRGPRRGATRQIYPYPDFSPRLLRCRLQPPPPKHRLNQTPLRSVRRNARTQVRWLRYARAERDGRQDGRSRFIARGPHQPDGRRRRPRRPRQRRRRERESYSLIVMHISDPDILRELSTQYLQESIGAWENTRRTCSPAISQLKLREISQQWDNLDMLVVEVGCNEHSITQMASHIRTASAHRAPQVRRCPVACASSSAS